MIDAPAWTCPACERRVPGKIDRCRCGQERPAALAQEESPAERAGRAPRTAVEGALLCLVIVAAGYYYTTAGSSATPDRTRAEIKLADRVQRREPMRTLAAGTAGDRGHATEPATTSELGNDRPEPSAPPLEDVIEHAMPGVVLVETTKTRGSGFLARPDVAVTNAHVIAGATTVSVTLQSGHEVTGTVLESSTELDLALVAIPSVDSSGVLPFGNSAALRLGQGVVALGWAADLHQSTVTRGIITGLRQQGKQRLVQTDAVPNHGDSGGPVLDRRGEVIGVTTFRAEVSGKTAGFAVAIDDVKALLQQSPVAGRQ
jgi:putative serine protease PepD